MARKILLPDGRELEVPDDAPPEQLAALKTKLREKYAPQLRSEEPAQAVPEQAPQRRGALEALASGADDFVRGLGRLPGVIAAGASKTAENFGRGAARIAGGEVSPDEFGGAMVKSAETMGRGIIKPFGGDAAIAGVAKMTGNKKPLEQLVGESEAYGEKLAADLPLQSVFGELYGAGKGAGMISRVPGLRIVKGKKAPVLRLVGQGATGAFATEYLQSGDVRKAVGAGATGGLMTPALKTAFDKLGKVGEVLGRTATKVPGVKATGRAAAAGAKAVLPIDLVKKAADYIARVSSSKNIPPGARKLRDTWKGALDDIETERQRVSRLVGDDVSLAEIADPETLRRLTPLIATQPIVGKAATEAAEAAEGAIPARMRESIPDARGVASVEEKLNFRDAQMTRDLAPFRNAAQPVTPGVVDILENPDVYALLSSPLKKEAAQILAGEIPFTINFVEKARQHLKKAGGTPAANKEARDYANTLRDEAGAIDSRYTAALKKYADASAFVGSTLKGKPTGGLREGMTVQRASTAEWEKGIASRAKENPLSVEGRKQGVYSGLAARAGEDIGGAASVADALTTPGLGRRLSATVGPDEAQRLQQVGRAEQRAMQNLAQLTPRAAKVKTAADEAELAVSSLAAAVGSAGVGFKANALAALGRRFISAGMSKQAATGLAYGLFNAQKAPDVIKILRRIDKLDEARAELAKIAARTVNVAAYSEGQE